MSRTMAAVLSALLAACGGADDAPAPSDPAPPPPAVPVIFAPGVVSTLAPEFSIAFSPDAQSAWFNRTSEDRSAITIMETQLVDGTWSEPVVAPFSGTYRDIDPFVSPDGSRLYFNSNRPDGPGDTSADFDTWYVARQGETWGEPVRLGEGYNSDSSEVFVSATRDGTVYFRSDRDGERRVYAVTTAGEARAIDIQTGGAVVSNPLIDPDGRFLIVVIADDAGADLFFACRDGDGFASPEPLAGVNSAFADFAPALSPDGATFYFTSERPGQARAVTDGSRPPGDIWSIATASLGIDCPG